MNVYSCCFNSNYSVVLNIYMILIFVPVPYLYPYNSAICHETNKHDKYIGNTRYLTRCFQLQGGRR